MLTFTVDGIPVAKARPRIGRGGHTYTPRKTKDHEQYLAWEIKSQFKRQWPHLLESALQVTIMFFLPRPKKCKHKYPQTRPDLDNYVKTVLDAMNGIVYKDDSQIIILQAEKEYVGTRGMKPCTIIYVETIDK